MSACPDDADPQLLAGLLNHEADAEWLLNSICADDRILAVVYAIVNDRDTILAERDRLRDDIAGIAIEVRKALDERDRLRDAIEPLRPYRVVIRANDDLFSGAGGLADAILGAVAALENSERT